MKMFSLIAMAVLSIGASARSLHPCTPTVEAKPTYIMCNQGKTGYHITINTLMSNPKNPMCQGDNHYEYKTAKVQVYTNNVPTGSFEILHGDFSYKLSPSGDAYFVSKKPRLVLDKCVTPIHGGMSVGN